jgi:DNA-directed RNA polymerase specialized sigma24 family protein
VLALEGLSHREISDVVGISENNVAVRLSRARGALADDLRSTGDQR